MNLHAVLAENFQLKSRLLIKCHEHTHVCYREVEKLWKRRMGLRLLGSRGVSASGGHLLFPPSLTTWGSSVAILSGVAVLRYYSAE